MISTISYPILYLIPFLPQVMHQPGRCSAPPSPPSGYTRYRDRCTIGDSRRGRNLYDVCAINYSIFHNISTGVESYSFTETRETLP
ncbi:hypothetical protein RRG08_053283 [Elysia crispata]|uniref:Uncharacterized protein n=1 Tax=Elysia crispata TaxID=231223 RepID=A0AAE0Z5V5_9GAST|nr:hypothetical protein RRG08_053283 [Elysia crispata]